MWQEIKEQIKEGKLNDSIDVYRFKESFTEKHNLDWGFTHCYFCCKFEECEVCPIVSTKENYEKYFTDWEYGLEGCVYYLVASNQTRCARKELKVSPRSEEFKTEVRLEACDRIIEAIKNIKEE